MLPIVNYIVYLKLSESRSYAKCSQHTHNNKNKNNKIGPEETLGGEGCVCNLVGEGFTGVDLFQTHLVVYVKYVQLFTCQTYLNKMLFVCLFEKKTFRVNNLEDVSVEWKQSMLATNMPKLFPVIFSDFICLSILV